MAQTHIGFYLDKARGMGGVDTRHQVLAKDVALFEVRVVVGDDLRQEVIHPQKGAQVLAELVGLLLREGGKAVGGWFEIGVEARLAALGVEEGLGEALDFAWEVHLRGVELDLLFVHDVGVGDIFQLRRPVVGLEALQNLVRGVYEIEHKGLVLAGVGAV